MAPPITPKPRKTAGGVAQDHRRQRQNNDEEIRGGTTDGCQRPSHTPGTRPQPPTTASYLKGRPQHNQLLKGENMTTIRNIVEEMRQGTAYCEYWQRDWSWLGFPHFQAA